MSDIEQNRAFIKSLLKKTGREGIDGLIEFLEQNDYFTAPASAKYHLNVSGGLALHSLNMYQALDLLNRHYGELLSHDSVTLISLLHDLCKINIYHPTFKDGEKVYEKKDSLPMGHGEKSIYIASRFITFKKEELLLIRWHMGPYDPEFQKNIKAIKEQFPYPKMAYLADEIAASISDEMFSSE